MGKRLSRKLPPWTGDDAALKAWTIAKLEENEASRFQEFVEGTKALAANMKRKPAMRTPEAEKYLRTVGLPTTPRSKAESRKRALTIRRRAAAKHREQREQRAAEEGDIEALRALHPKHAAFINPIKPKRKRPLHDHDGQGLSPEDRLTEAREELTLIHALWKEAFGRTNRPSGTLTAEQVAAEHWGLDEKDVRKDRVHKATRQRLARQR
jgi:hypothetical protein